MHAGFHSLPVELQAHILDLAVTAPCPSEAKARATWGIQRSVCKRWDALAYLMRRKHRRVSFNESQQTYAVLPYMPAVQAVTCSGTLQPAFSAFLSSVLSIRVAAMPTLTELDLNLPCMVHVASVASALNHCPQLTRLALECSDHDAVQLPANKPMDSLQLRDLRQLRLDLGGPGVPALKLPHLLMHLSSMCRLQLLDCRSDACGGEQSLAQLLVLALPALPALQSLTVGGWECLSSAPWVELPRHIAALPQLTRLSLLELALIGSSGSVWLGVLSVALRELTRLQSLCLEGPSPATLSSADEYDLQASQRLAQAVGSLVRLSSLSMLDVGRHVSVHHCCEHLRGLVRLTSLWLRDLAAADPTEVPSRSYDGRAYAALLAGMAELHELKVEYMYLHPREELSLCSDAISGLSRLTALSLQGNGLDLAPVSLLASTVRALPRLQHVFISENPWNDESGDERADTLQWHTGRSVFE